MTPDKIKQLNELMGSEFFMVTPDHLTFNELNAETQARLKDDAKVIMKTAVWKWLMNEMKLVAQENMFNKAENYEAMIGGKFTLYTLDVLDKKLKNLAK